MENELIGYVYSLFQSGTTDYLKNIIGKNFEKLEKYCLHNDTDSFNNTLNIILNSNEEIKQNLEMLKNGDTLNQYNKNGHNFNNTGDITITNYLEKETKYFVNIKKHPLFKRYRSLEEIELNNDSIKDIRKQSETLIEHIKSYNNGAYVKEVKKLIIFNHVYSISVPSMKLTNPYEELDNNYNDRKKLIQNKDKVKKLICEIINFNSN